MGEKPYATGRYYYVANEHARGMGNAPVAYQPYYYYYYYYYVNEQERTIAAGSWLPRASTNRVNRAVAMVRWLP